MNDTLEMVLVIVVYSVVMIFAGVGIGKVYFNHQLPAIQKAAFMRGASMGIDFGVAQEKRDELQGVPCQPEKIK